MTTVALVALVALVAPVAGAADGDLPAQLAAAHEPGSVMIIGELHGTQETPALVHALLARLPRHSPAVLGLEIPRQEQARIDAYLASDGGADARAALLSGAFWQRPVERSDGRRSQAMLGLLEAIRQQGAGARIRVAALDDQDFFADDADRQAGLAAGITRLRQQTASDAAVVVLLGNYHARLAAPDDVWSDGERLAAPPLPTAARIRDVPVIAVDVTACGGGFWTCRSSDAPCAVVELAALCDAAGAPRLQRLDPHTGDYHLRVILPRLTPSPPVQP